MKPLNVVDLFAGVGGLSYGFCKDSFFNVIAANEILPNTAKAYSLNHPNVKMYNMDIKDFGISNLVNDLRINENDIDIVIGGPPCQAYSTVGKRLLDDPRGKLFQEYYRILKEFKPKFFLFENVKGILSMNKGVLIEHIIDLFKSLGYRVQMKLLNAADYGTPQIRERVIIVGNNIGKDFVFPEPTHYDPSLGTSLFNSFLKPYVTLGEAIGDLTVIEAGEEGFSYSSEPQNEYQKLMRKDAPNLIMDHSTSRNNPELIHLMTLLPDGGSPEDLPEVIRPKSGFKNTYCRLWWNKPSTTITRNLGCPSSSRCIHPKSARSLSTREGARLQGFPDSYFFFGSRAEKNLQIGNAVPTFLSIALCKAVKKLFSE